MIRIKCISCTDIFNSLNELSMHLSNHKILIFKCNFKNCNRKYSRKSCYIQHIQREHINDYSNVSNIETQYLTSTLEPHCSFSIIPNVREDDNLISSDNDNMILADKPNIKKLIFKLSSQLYADPKIPRSTTELILKNFKNVLDLLIKEYSNYSSQPFENIFNCSSDFEFLRSEYMFFAELKKNCDSFVPAQTFAVHKEREASLALDNTLRIKELQCSVKFIPLREIFSKLFNNTKYLLSIINYQKSIENSVYIKSFNQSKFFKSLLPLNQNNNTLYLALVNYVDDYGINRALGSHSSLNKITGMYCSILGCPEEIASKLINVITTQLFFADDIKRFSFSRLLTKLIEELNYLSEDGIVVCNSSFPHIEKVIILSPLFTADNLALNQILGFVESFRSTSYCRFCKCTSQECGKLCKEVSNKVRNESNYKDDLELNDKKETGIVGPSALANINFFSVVNNLAVDIMHDLCEGVCHYSFLTIIKICVEENYFTIHDLNARILSFNYSPHYSNNKPPLLHDNVLSFKKFQFSAEEMYVFTVYFAFFIGDRVPHTSQVWRFYISLRQIMTICFADSLPRTGMNQILNNYVSQFNDLYLKLSKNPLKPKFHNLTHYGRILEEVGLLKPLSCFRFEQMHQLGKTTVQSSQNRINSLETISIKQQIQVANNIMNFDDIILDIMTIKPGKVINSIDKSQIKIKYNFECEHDFQVITYIIYNHFKYIPGLVLEIEYCFETKMRKFGVIEHLIKYNDEYYLALKILNVKDFNINYYAYEVDDTLLQNCYCVLNFNTLDYKKTSLVHKISNKNLINWFNY